jgi:hypothetical protein
MDPNEYRSSSIESGQDNYPPQQAQARDHDDQLEEVSSCSKTAKNRKIEKIGFGFTKLPFFLLFS